MSRPRRTDPLAPQIRAVLMAELGKQTNETLFLLKQLNEKLTIVIAKLHNLGVDAEANASRSKTLLAALGELLTKDEQTVTEAQAIVKDFLYQTLKKK